MFRVLNFKTAEENCTLAPNIGWMFTKHCLILLLSLKSISLIFLLLDVKCVNHYRQLVQSEWKLLLTFLSEYTFCIPNPPKNCHVAKCGSVLGNLDQSECSDTQLKWNSEYEECWQGELHTYNHLLCML